MTQPTKYSWLFYGTDASGKSWILASAFQDQFTGEVLRGGIILDFEEKMGHLRLPESVLWDCRPNPTKPDKGLKTVRDWIVQYRSGLLKGEHPHEVIGMDSLSEFQSLYRVGLAMEVANNSPKEDPEVLSERSWGKIYQRIMYDLGYLKAAKLDAHFICTAGAEYYDDDDDNPDPFNVGHVQPTIAGKLRKKLGHIFDMIVYVEKIEPNKKNKLKEVVHRYHFAKTAESSDFRVRNGLEHLGVFPPYLDGTASSPLQFDTILKLIQEVEPSE